MRIIIVGSNPSRKSPDNSAFHKDTQSRQTIESWFENYYIPLDFCNVVDEPTPGNKPLSKSILKDNLHNLKAKVYGYDKIIAVGEVPSRALTLLGVEHFCMWHPSGLNRKWNDKEAAAVKIQELLRYCNVS